MKTSIHLQKILLYFCILLIPISIGRTQEIIPFKPDGKSIAAAFPDVGDNREPVLDTSLYPWRTVCKIYSTFRDFSAWGTGTIIGPRLVLTAAHVVYNKENHERATLCEIIPGYDEYSINGKKPFGSIYSKSVMIYPEYLQCPHEKIFKYDIALIETNTDIGKQTGWLGVRSANDYQLNEKLYYIVGYPADLNDGKRMYLNEGKFESWDNNEVFYKFATYKGMSGSGIFHIDAGHRYIVAVCTAENIYVSNYGIRINKYVLDWINKIENNSNASSITSSNIIRKIMFTFDDRMISVHVEIDPKNFKIKMEANNMTGSYGWVVVRFFDENGKMFKGPGRSYTTFDGQCSVEKDFTTSSEISGTLAVVTSVPLYVFQSIGCDYGRLNFVVQIDHKITLEKSDRYYFECPS